MPLATFVLGPLFYSSSSNHKSASLKERKETYKIYKLLHTDRCGESIIKSTHVSKIWFFLKRISQIESPGILRRGVRARVKELNRTNRRRRGWDEICARRRMNQKKREKAGPVNATWFKAKYYDRTRIPATPRPRARRGWATPRDEP